MSEEYTQVEMCSLHREVINTKLKAADDRIDNTNLRIDSIMDELMAVRELQTSIRNYIIFIACGVILTLIGVVLGRGFDFGWVMP